MRNLILALVVAIIVLLSGIFTVDEHEIVVANNHFESQNYKEYTTGIYWSTPFINDITYVYNNERSDYFNPAKPVILGESQLTASYLLHWKVTNPIAYVRYLNANSTKQFDYDLAMIAANQIEISAREVDGVDDFKQKLSNVNNINSDKLGVKLIDISILSNKVSSVDLVPEESNSLVNKNELNSFKQAMLIKSQADMLYQQNMTNLKKRNSQLLNDLITVNNIESSTHSKEMVPPINQLFK